MRTGLAFWSPCFHAPPFNDPMPGYVTRLKQAIGAEVFITRHARSTTGEDHLMQRRDNVDMAIYLRYLANDSPIKMDTKSKHGAMP